MSSKSDFASNATPNFLIQLALLLLARCQRVAELGPMVRVVGEFADQPADSSSGTGVPVLAGLPSGRPHVPSSNLRNSKCLLEFVPSIVRRHFLSKAIVLARQGFSDGDRLRGGCLPVSDPCGPGFDQVGNGQQKRAGASCWAVQ